MPPVTGDCEPERAAKGMKDVVARVLLSSSSGDDDGESGDEEPDDEMSLSSAPSILAGGCGAFAELGKTVGCGEVAVGFPGPDVNWDKCQLIVQSSDLRRSRVTVGGTYVAEFLDQVLVLVRAHCRPVSRKCVRSLLDLHRAFGAINRTKVASFGPLWSAIHKTALTAKLVLSSGEGGRERSSEVIASSESIVGGHWRGGIVDREDAAPFASWLQLDRARRLAKQLIS